MASVRDVTLRRAGTSRYWCAALKLKGNVREHQDSWGCKTTKEAITNSYLCYSFTPVCLLHYTQKWNILCLWVWWGFEVPSCITDGGILHECHAASLSRFTSLQRINSPLLENQINTPQQSLRRFHFSMKWKPHSGDLHPGCVCESVCE